MRMGTFRQICASAVVAAALLSAGGATQTASAAQAIFDPIPAPKPKGQPSTLADRNGNGISDALEARLNAMGAGDAVNVIVTFSGAGNAASAQRAVGPFKVESEFGLINGFSATMRAGQARALANVAGVFRVEEVFPVSIHMQTERRDFGADEVHSFTESGGVYNYDSAGYHGKGIGVCIVDTGVLDTHIALAGRVDGKVDYSGDPNDIHWHGTHVAGIVAGAPVGSGASVETQFYGVAPEARIYDARVLDSGGRGFSDDIIAGIQWCAGNGGVHVINMSLGFDGSSDGSDAVSQAVNAAVAAGKVVVVSAGNEGATTYTIGAPGAAAEAITVGAVREWSKGDVQGSQGCLNCISDGGIGVVSFSSRGPTADERIKPDIVGPGVNVWSAYVHPQKPTETNWYASANGTSMSSPFVAGTVALMLGADNSLSPQDIREILFNTAQSRGAPGKDVDYGHGLVDVRAAVETAAGVQSPTPTPFPNVQYFGGMAVSKYLLENLGGHDTPLNVTMLIEGKVACVRRRGRFCLGEEWDPDLDAQLLFDDSEIDLSTCMVGDDCGLQPGGRQETLINPAITDHGTGTGTYELNVIEFSSSTKNPKFSYEVSGGTLGVVVQDAPIGGDQAPSVSIASPSGTVSGEVTIQVDANDAEDAVETLIVQVSIAGGAYNSAAYNDTNGMYEFIWDTIGADEGDNTIEASATDSAGNTTDAAPVTVTVDNDEDPVGGDISLSANGYKVKGVKHVDLTWSGATTNVDVFRDGFLRQANTANDGEYTDNTGEKGGGSYTYVVCETGGTDVCSDPVVVAF